MTIEKINKVAEEARELMARINILEDKIIKDKYALQGCKETASLRRNRIR